MERVVCNVVVLREVASELGLPLDQVKTIVSCQSEYTKMVMESNTFDSIRWPYLGVFKCKPKEVQMINHLRGMTEEQQRDFKKALKTGKIKFNHWEEKLKAKKKKHVDKETNTTEVNTSTGTGGDQQNNP